MFCQQISRLTQCIKTLGKKYIILWYSKLCDSALSGVKDKTCQILFHQAFLYMNCLFPTFFDFKDLIQVNSGQLQHYLKKIISFCKKHVYGCEVIIAWLFLILRLLLWYATSSFFCLWRGGTREREMLTLTV